MHFAARLAEHNLQWLRDNPYPGRGIVAGVNSDGDRLVIVYFITGRSENSRNRILREEDGRVFTEAADPSKMKDPSLIIYRAMRDLGGYSIVSNGDQTDTCLDGLAFAASCAGGMNFVTPDIAFLLRNRIYEPDKPNFTSRITALCSIGDDPEIQMSILRKSLLDVGCEQLQYQYGRESLRPGYGYGITTYSDDGDPLPAFRGDPLILPLHGAQLEIMDRYWGALNEDNRVAIAVKFVGLETGRSTTSIINTRQKVVAEPA